MTPLEHIAEERPFNFFATNEKCRVRLVKPLQKIMGNWLLCENEQGMQWHIPFGELQAVEAKP